MSVSPSALLLNDTRTELGRALSALVDAIYDGSEDDCKIALTHLLDVWDRLYRAIDAVLGV